MATFSSQGTQETYESELLAWLSKKIQSGLETLKKEKAFTDMPLCIDYVNGSQKDATSSKALSKLHDNRLRKIVLESVSALTDVRPIWNYDTNNEAYKDQSQILNKLARGWWKNARADRRLQSILTFSCVGGSGYGFLYWNKDLPGGGDFELIPLDPRDVVPIDPVFSDSVQDWRGVAIRERLSLEHIRAMYPAKGALLTERPPTVGWFGQDFSRGSRLSDIISPVWSWLSGKGGTSPGKLSQGVDLIRVFFKDDSLLTEGEPRVMGDPDSNWSYTVYPVGSIKPNGEEATKEEALLYPRGRLIICTPDMILEDLPNPYWHGLFPVIKFTLDPLPWSLLGGSMVSDLLPIQGSLNESLRGLDDARDLWISRGIVADSQAISKQNIDALDPRKPGMRARINATMGEGFKIIDGPVLPEWYMKYVEFLKNEIDENSGVRGLQQMAQLKQMPSAETMEKFMDALSPLLRLRARSIETSLSELAEMLKVGFFQYYDMSRRMQILGPSGTVLEDFDYDPQEMVPDNIPGDTREARASVHHRNFSFSIAPNSFLNVSHAMQRMLIFQAFRANGLDIYSFWEAMDLTDIGPKPAESIPERLVWARKLGLQPGPTPELIEAQTAAAIAQAQLQVMQIQQMLGGGALPMGPTMGSAGAQGASPGGAPTSGVSAQGGRPPSGQQAPQIRMKDGGTRMTVSESG